MNNINANTMQAAMRFQDANNNFWWNFTIDDDEMKFEEKLVEQAFHMIEENCPNEYTIHYLAEDPFFAAEVLKQILTIQIDQFDIESAFEDLNSNLETKEIFSVGDDFKKLLVGLLFIVALLISAQGLQAQDVVILSADTEATHGVDRNVIEAIYKLESTNGTSNIALTKCNYFGLRKWSGESMVFDSKEDCFDFFGDMLNRLYPKCMLLTYPEEILECMSNKYCPENCEVWLRETVRCLPK